jgi:hypothetical protein
MDALGTTRVGDGAAFGAKERPLSARGKMGKGALMKSGRWPGGWTTSSRPANPLTSGAASQWPQCPQKPPARRGEEDENAKEARLILCRPVPPGGEAFAVSRPCATRQSPAERALKGTYRPGDWVAVTGPLAARAGAIASRSRQSGRVTLEGFTRNIAPLERQWAPSGSGQRAREICRGLGHLK